MDSSNMRKRLQSHLLYIVTTLILISCQNKTTDNYADIPIDRQALVSRHHPTVHHVDKLSPFTVGNGEFAFTADVTGLQTFMDYYENGISLGTQSHWGWHTCPNPKNYTLEQASNYYDTDGRQVSYASDMTSEAAQWLRANPHRLHLGQVGFQIKGIDGKPIQLDDIGNIHQTLNLWEGILCSNFMIEKDTVIVKTCCHPQLDQIAVRVHSELIHKSRLSVIFHFPYGSLSWGKSSGDWESPDKHETIVLEKRDNFILLERRLDTTKYYMTIHWKGKALFNLLEKHKFILEFSEGEEFELACHFSPELPAYTLPTTQETFKASKEHWKNFWLSGGAIDLSESTDPRAKELERRIVLSQYLMAIQCAGSLPPQETGLTCNSWFGKFHLEMHWWHAVHFVIWGRPQLLEKSLAWYESILPIAKQTAMRQGYDGARWPKMVGPDGSESPSKVGVFLIWQQPHPIYYAELLYRTRKDRATLERYKTIVFETADFMASYAAWDEVQKRYILGPPLIPAQEIYEPESTMNPAFELSYWAFGLKTAQRWRERLGLPRNEKWDHVLAYLSTLPEKNGLYQNTETAMTTFEDEFHRNDHPTLLGAYGMLPNDRIDVDIMRNTLKQVLASWNWNRTWGWDYPLIAMSAARVGEPELAVDALLLDVQKNTYLTNGHNYQDERLTLYLPGNGGLLTAVAMMAAGWDGSPEIHAPGFPTNGNWIVKWEGLSPLP
jgi:hypothetical protein